MNSNIIPLGPSEVLALVATTVTKESMLIEALTDLTITALSFSFNATPANAGKTVAFTLLAGSHLFWVKSITYTGTAVHYYSGRS